MTTTLTTNRYMIGQLVRSSNEFRTVPGGALIDPTAVFFRARKQNGTVIAYTYPTDVQLVRDGVGLYHVDLSTDNPGIWKVRWYSTGTGQAAGEDRWVVAPSEVL